MTEAIHAVFVVRDGATDEERDREIRATVMLVEQLAGWRRMCAEIGAPPRAIVGAIATALAHQLAESRVEEPMGATILATVQRVSAEHANHIRATHLSAMPAQGNA